MVLYIVLVVIAAIIVVLYCIFEFGGKPPVIDQPDPPKPPDSSSPAVSGDPNGGENDPDASNTPVSGRRDEVYTCLIFGLDAISGSTDTIMVATFDVPNQRIGLVSIPRDTVVRRDRSAPWNKVNAAYAIGGVEQLDKELEELLGIPVDYYVKIKLSAFEKLVDEIGGVWFDVPRDMDYDDPDQNLHIHLKEGYQKLDGNQAMGLVRFRQDNYGHDSFGDVGRAGVQQAFLKAMLSQIISGVNLSSIPGLMDVLLNYVETNADLNAALYFGKALLGMDLDAGIVSDTLPASWHSPYMWVEEEEALSVINDLLNPFSYEITEDMVEFFKR